MGRLSLTLLGLALHVPYRSTVQSVQNYLVSFWESIHQGLVVVARPLHHPQKIVVILSWGTRGRLHPVLSHEFTKCMSLALFDLKFFIIRSVRLDVRSMRLSEAGLLELALAWYHISVLVRWVSFSLSTKEKQHITQYELTQKRRYDLGELKPKLNVLTTIWFSVIRISSSAIILK